ncbi:MAG: peptidylprolyl isomerase [Sinobacteraceae bacterium]|nr:peptidylprolyl isomerase [Nevskiaceae bacterium]
MHDRIPGNVSQGRGTERGAAHQHRQQSSSHEGLQARHLPILNPARQQSHPRLQYGYTAPSCHYPETPLSIKTNSVVRLHYTLKDDAGAVIDRSAAEQPLTYLHGHGNLVPGLERELEGKSAGEQFSVTVPPAEGYGERSNELVQKVPRRALKGLSKVSVGMRLQAQTPDGPRALTVTQVAGDMVTLDGNHPLAGQNLNFDIVIAEVREATAEEISHGHVHGPGGHH